jgi:hypothetical protein
MVDEDADADESELEVVGARQAAELASTRTVRIETADGASFVVMPEGSAAVFEQLARDRGLAWMAGACLQAPKSASSDTTARPAAAGLLPNPRLNPTSIPRLKPRHAGYGGDDGAAETYVYACTRGPQSPTYTGRGLPSFSESCAGLKPNGDATRALPPTKAVMGLPRARILQSWVDASLRDGGDASPYRELLGTFVSCYDSRKKRVF